MLSEPLKLKLLMDANKIALKESPVFKNNFSQQAISKVVNSIKEVRLTPEEILFKSQ